MRIRVVELFCLIGIYIVASFGCNNESKDQKVLDEAKLDFQNYLKEKYKKEFVVENVEKYARALGEQKIISAIAYPKDNKNVKFQISTFEDYKVSTEPVFAESFLSKLWTKQVKEKIQDDFDGTFQDQAKYRFTVQLSRDKTENWNDEPIDYFIAEEKFTDDIRNVLHLMIFSNWSNSNEKEEAVKPILSFLSHLENIGINNLELYLDIYNPEFKTEILTRSDYYFSIVNSPRAKLFDENILIHACNLRKEKVKAIKTASDLINNCSN